MDLLHDHNYLIIICTCVLVSKCQQEKLKWVHYVEAFCWQVELQGILKVHVLRGTNLAIRDVKSSDPYVVVTTGEQVRFSWLLL